MAQIGPVTQAGTGRSAALIIPQRLIPYLLGVQCTVSGTATYTLQHTMDDVQKVASPTWVNTDNTNMVSATTTQTGNYVVPVNALSVNIASGSGSVTLTCVLAGLVT